MERPISALTLLTGHPLARCSIPKDVEWSLAIGQLRSNWGQPTARVCLCCSKGPTTVYSQTNIVCQCCSQSMCLHSSLHLLFVFSLCAPLVLDMKHLHNTWTFRIIWHLFVINSNCHACRIVQKWCNHMILKEHGDTRRLENQERICHCDDVSLCNDNSVIWFCCCWSTKLCAHHTHLPFGHKANKIVVRKSGWKLTSLSILTPSWNWPPTRCLFFVCCQHHIHKEFLLHMWCKFARSKRHLKCPCASQPQTNSSCIYCIITNLSCADEFSPMTPMKHCASSTKQQPPGWSGGTVLLKKVHTLSTKIIGIQSNHRFKCRNGWLCFSDRRAGTAMFIATIWTNVPLIRRLWIIRMILVNTHAI